MTTAGHAAAMRQCIADSCLQGRAACKTPMQCSGAATLVDESVEHWQLHRLQDVRPTVYLAPGVVEGPSEPDEFIKSENALTACARWALVALLVWIGLYVVAGYIAAAFRWL